MLLIQCTELSYPFTASHRILSMEGQVSAEKRPTYLQDASISVMMTHSYITVTSHCMQLSTRDNERLNSQLKLLRSCLRSTMAEECMSGLAMIKIHRRRASELNLDILVTTFVNKQDESSMCSVRIAFCNINFCSF